MSRLGAVCEGTGTRFTLHAPHCSAAWVCLRHGMDEQRLAMVRVPDAAGTWELTVEGVGAGQRYGFRVDGPWEPAAGRWSHPSRLLLDPYARAVDGRLLLHPDGTAPGGGTDLRDTAGLVPVGVVVPDLPALAAPDRQRPWAEHVVYELHVKGFTATHPDIPVPLRGTYAGLAHPAAIEHLLRLGVTAVELLPVQHFVSEPHLLRRGLVNYWGYNPVAWFAPHSGYAAAGPDGAQQEFAAMVAALHQAGLAVLVDVVYNHTGEGDEVGPTLSLRGLDNPAAYLLDPADPTRYRDTTGCGATVRVEQQHALVVGSLRHWVQTFGVDGFRFDLAPALLRTGPDGARVDRRAAFLQAVQDDPVLSRVHLVAEPWDLGPDGYQLGGFPAPWAEWNDRFRDTARAFWAGQARGVGELATRLAGSRDVFPDRGPAASVNLVTAHDGFTLRDLTTYQTKRNAANGEQNRDGDDHNLGWNCGVEGETADPAVNGLRVRQARNLLATLLLSAGVPMLSMGDEVRRTQQGNNNAYCQDGPLSWQPWERSPDATALTAFVAQLVQLRADAPALRGGDVAAQWFSARGPAGPDLWQDGGARTLGMLLDATATGGSALLVLLHAGPQPCPFALPPGDWEVLLDTAQSAVPDRQSVELAPHSLAVLGRR